MSKQPLFESHVKSTLDRCTSIFNERGGQYGDTWAHCQFLAMRAVARKLGAAIPEDTFRALAAAALFDTKYQRLEGGYKQDTIDDGINYGAFMDAEVQVVLARRKRQRNKHPL